MTGAAADSCTVTLSATAPSGGLTVNLSTNSSAVTVPESVTVPANATSAGFTATVSAVATARTITLTATAGSVSETFDLLLNADASTLSLATSGSPSTYGSPVTFTATISSGATGAVTFYDGSASIGAATIDGTTALVTTSSLTTGSHTITANWPGNTSYGASTSGAITQLVNKASPAIAWAAPAAINYGTALSATQLDATSPVAGTFAYSPAAGTVLKPGMQTLSVTFTPADTTSYTTATVTVLLTVNPATPPISWPTPAAVSYGTALGAPQLDATSPVAGSFSYSPAAGTVLTAGNHTISATFAPADPADYSTASASVSITVNQVAPAVSWAPPAAITAGTALSSAQLDASSTVPGTFAYNPAAGTVLTAGAHTLSVTFTPTDNVDYKVATATVVMTVNSTTQATPTITWPTPAAITYGMALSTAQLDATSPVPGSFSYSPTVGTVLNAGTRTLSVTFTPTDTTTFISASATVTLTVNQATPALNWPAPSPINYGTALSSTQLDAVSSVAGTFTYSPAAETVLAVGSQTLSVTFTPADSIDYRVTSATVPLTVIQGSSLLSINAASVSFGNVSLNSPATQTVILSSAGTASVTINSVAATGIGFTVSSPTLPATLTSGQTATLDVQFDPTLLGAAIGTLTITSTSSGNGTVLVPLAGIGVAVTYAVDLSWDAPASSTDPIAGYNVYRSPGGSTTYQLLNSSVNTLTTYTDSTVENGQTYDYVVESVDNSGVESVPSSPIAVTIP